MNVLHFEGDKREHELGTKAPAAACGQFEGGTARCVAAHAHTAVARVERREEQNDAATAAARSEVN